MSAINVLVQKDAVHMLTDGSVYKAGGVLIETDMDKTNLVLGGRAVIACTGPALLGEYIAENIRWYETFDNLVAYGAATIGKLFEEYVQTHRNGDAVGVLYLIGWHEKGDRPAAYGMDMQTGGKKADWVRTNNPHVGKVDLFKLSPIPISAMPSPTIQQMLDASYDLTSDLLKIDAETDLLHMMQIQRQIPYDGIHYVGGNALMTTVDRDGISQRILHTWSEDKVGEVINPQPIDYKRWLAERHAATNVLRH